MRRGVFAAWLGAIVGVALLQSAVHLVVVLGCGDVGTVVDLDRSNGLPDIVSTPRSRPRRPPHPARASRAGRAPRCSDHARRALGAPDARGPRTRRRLIRRSWDGWLVIATGRRRQERCSSLIALASGARARVTLAVAGCLLVGVVPRQRARPARASGSSASAATRSPSTRSSRRRGSSCSAGRSSRSRSGTRRFDASTPRRAPLQRELLEHGLHRDDVPLEAELRVGQAGGDADQL